MNNKECIVAVLTAHREARAWDDNAVASDLISQLGLEADGDAKNARPVINPDLMTEDQVKAAEAAAKQATDKARVAREALENQDKHKNDAPAHPDTPVVLPPPPSAAINELPKDAVNPASAWPSLRPDVETSGSLGEWAAAKPEPSGPMSGKPV